MNIVICDDEPSVLIDVEKIIKEAYAEILLDKGIKDVLNIKVFSTVFALTDYLQSNSSNVDAIFLDIMIDKDNGINEARNITNNYPNINIVFMTGFISFAEDIFEADPIYFIVKPVQADKLKSALEKIIEEKKKDNLYIYIKWNKNIYCVPQNKIMYIESRGRYVKVICEEEEYSSILKLDDIALRLSSDFIRVHKSFIVNISYIKKYESLKLQLINEKEIPISRKYNYDVKRAMIDYIGR